MLAVMMAAVPLGCRPAEDPRTGSPASNEALDSLDPTSSSPFASLDQATNERLERVQAEALQLARQDDYPAAEQRMVELLAEVEIQHGAGTPPWAAAQFQCASLYLMMDRVPDAIQALEQACEVQVDDLKGPAQRDRLTYLMNLGDVLTMTREFENAEEVLREGLVQRAAFYGQDHPGYAFGLEPLARLLTIRGKHEEAIELANEALENLRASDHDRQHSARLTQWAAYAAAGQVDEELPDAEELTREQVTKLARIAIQEASRADPAWSYPLLVPLTSLVDQRLPDDDVHRLNLQITLANAARAVDDHRQRAAAMKKVVKLCRASGRQQNEFDALLGLAWAESDAGKKSDALQTYAAALQLAEQFGQDLAIAETHRNWGLLLSESGEPEAAEPHLTEAVARCRQAGDAEKLAGAEITLGIFLQHQKRFDEAQELLQAGWEKLSPTHPDAICGLSHLRAMEQREECGCGDIARVLAESLRQYVLQRLPEDLMKDVQFQFTPGEGPRIRFDTHRSPNPEESQLMNRTAKQALADFRRQLRQSLKPGPQSSAPPQAANRR